MAWREYVQHEERERVRRKERSSERETDERDLKRRVSLRYVPYSITWATDQAEERETPKKETSAGTAAFKPRRDK